MFTIVNALWLRPLSVSAADRLVVVVRSSPPGDAAFFRIEGPAWRAFEATAGQVITSDREAGLQPRIALAGVQRQVETLGVTLEYFRLFGLSIRGRDFTPEDNRQGAEPVGIISDRLWTREFNRRAEVIGALVTSTPFTLRIIGVAPPDFQGARRGEMVDIWIPTTLIPRASRRPESSLLPLMVFGRLHPGQSVHDASRRFQETHVDERHRRLWERLAIVPLSHAFGTPESHTIMIRETGVLSVVASLAVLVLLGGCATLMSLVLVHYERRRRELAIKTVLGASGRRIATELSRELAILTVSGTVGALLVAVWGLRTLPALNLPGGVNLGRLNLSIDGRVLGVAVLTTVLTLVLAALLPMRRTMRLNLALEMVADLRPHLQPTHDACVRLSWHFKSLQRSSFSWSLDYSCGTVARGLRLGSGFDVDRTLFVTLQTLSPLRAIGPIDSELQAIRERSNSNTRSTPRSAWCECGCGRDVSHWLGPSNYIDCVASHPDWTTATRVAPGAHVWGGELLRTIGVPMLLGRGLTDADATASPLPAVVTGALAESLWPGEDPLGQILSVQEGGRDGSYVVVGIADDFCFGSFSRPAAGVLITVRQEAFGIEPHFVLRATNATALVDTVRKVIQQALPDAPWVKVETGREIVGRDLGPQRLGAWFFSGFGLVALILGVGGVFGLVAYLAESQQYEFGIRLALGATRRDVILHSVAAALFPVSIGVAVGVGFAAGVARLLTSLLVGLSALDPLTYGTVATTMLACAALAGLSAALRLRRLDASDALRTN